MKISSEIEKLDWQEAAKEIDVSCVYMMKNLKNGKSYIGLSYNAVHRIKCHYYSLRSGSHNVETMQKDFKAGDEFEIIMLCSFNRKDHARKTKALETFFILQYDRVKNGYNTTYNYPSVERAYEIVENNAEYIIGCLRKNGIRFKLQCGIEDVLEITP